jgi:hypothetical protein
LGDKEKRFFVVTGGPGSGKSSLIDRLQRNGYAGSVEAGRGIIQDQVIVGGIALPWSDPMLFAELMLSWEMRVLPLRSMPPARCSSTGGCPMCWDIRGCRVSPRQDTWRGRPRCSGTTVAYSSPRHGKKFFNRTASASRVSMKLSGLTTCSSRRTPHVAMSSWKFRGSRSNSESASFFSL